MKMVAKRIFIFLFILLLEGLLIPSLVLAAEPVTIASIAGNLTTTTRAIGKIIVNVAIVAGVGFVLASFFKFHQHKNNPTQVPISHGLTLLVIGTGMVLIPSLLPTVGNAIMGSADLGKIGSNSLSDILGDDGGAGS